MLRPLQDKVIVQLQKEETTTGGIILTDSAKNKTSFAKVIAVGPGILMQGYRSIMEVREGDNIFIKKDVGIPVEYDGDEYTIITQDDILAVVK